MKNSPAPAGAARDGRELHYQPSRGTRRRRHVTGAVIVAAYLLAAAVAAGAHEDLEPPLWLALHLLVLGAATNAVFIWSWHFAEALLHARAGSQRAAYLRLAVLNAGIAAVLAGVPAGQPVPAVAGAVLVMGAVCWHVAGLAGMLRGCVLAGRLRVVTWFYLAGGGALLAGAGLGGVLAAGVIRSGRMDEALRLAHAHLNLLGWLGLAIAGTSFMLWPAVLRTRMAENAPAWARRVLAVSVTGLAVAVAGLLGTPYAPAWRWLAVAGLTCYGAGVAGSLIPAVAAMRRRRPASAPAWGLLTGTGWLLAAIATDAAALARGPGQADRALSSALVIMLVLGVIAQILTGALTFLLPVVAGGGPAGNRRLARVMEGAWRTRAVLVNAGLLLLVVPAAGPVRLAGWVAVLAGYVPFPVLTGAGLLGSRRAA